MSLKNPFDQGYFYTNELRGFGFRKVGDNVAIAKDCVINGLENISLENNIRIDSKATIIAIYGKLNIGSNVHIAGNCYVNSTEGIEMEDFSCISFGVSLFSISDDYSGKFLTNSTIPEKFKNIKKGPIILKRHVLIGTGTVILPNVTIGEGAAVGALSLITKSIPSYKIYCGIPAKFLKDRSKDFLDIENLFLNSK